MMGIGNERFLLSVLVLGREEGGQKDESGSVVEMEKTVVG